MHFSVPCTHPAVTIFDVVSCNYHVREHSDLLSSHGEGLALQCGKESLQGDLLIKFTLSADISLICN